jgi:hypothetical protein
MFILMGVTARDWLTADEAALDSYATARRLSRLGDDRYDTLTDSIFDEDAELLDILDGVPPHTPPPRKAENKNHRA